MSSTSNTTIPVSEQLVVASDPAPHVRLLSLNRPSKRNALSQDTIKALLAHLSAAGDDRKVRVAIIAGAGSFFSAGADIKEIAALDSDGARKARYLEDLCNGLASFRKPLLAAVEGMADSYQLIDDGEQLGGGFELALMCDMIVASEDAKFGLPEVKIGLLPGAGGTQRLTSAVGKYKAMKMILSGTPVSSEHANQIGIVSELAKPGGALETAMSIASELLKNSSSAMMLAKEAIQRSTDTTIDELYERNLYYSAFSNKDKVEGISAFLEKRQPDWPSTKE